MKSKMIAVPMTEDMHNKVVAHVKEKGFDSVAAYVRMLIRDDLNRPADREEHF